MQYTTRKFTIEATEIVSAGEKTATADNFFYPLALKDGTNYEMPIAQAGDHVPQAGDYVIFGKNSDTYLCPASVFYEKYTPVATVGSASDQRTANNVMRHAYRVLSDEEKKQMQTIKDQGLAFYNALVDAFGATPDGRFPSRELSLAVTKIEEAVMWAVKHVTK